MAARTLSLKKKKNSLFLYLMLSFYLVLLIPISFSGWVNDHMGNAGVDQAPVNLVMAMDSAVATTLRRAHAQMLFLLVTCLAAFFFFWGIDNDWKVWCFQYRLFLYSRLAT